MTRFEIEIFSDIVCPYCYIGKKSLDRAIGAYQAQYPDAEFVLTWVPFLLYPGVKSGIVSHKKAPFEARFGADVQAAYDRLEQTATSYGISINWDGVLGNSLDAHKLILLATEKDLEGAGTRQDQERRGQENGNDVGETATETITLSPTCQTPLIGATAADDSGARRGSERNANLNAVVAALFHGIWEAGRDLGDRAFLAETAVTCGLAADEAAAQLWLQSGQSDGRGEETEESMATWQASLEIARTRAEEVGVNGVPTYMVQGRYQIGGVQEPELFLNIFDKVQLLERVGTATGAGLREPRDEDTWFRRR